MERGAGRELRAVHEHDVVPAELRQVVGDRRPADTAADDHRPRVLDQALRTLRTLPVLRPAERSGSPTIREGIAEEGGPMGRLEGRVALITGGAGAIGAATASRLARDGASVVIADRDADRAQAVAATLEGAGASSIGIAVDVTDDASVRDMVAAAEARFGKLDALFTCSGVLATGSVTETSIADWDRSIAVNLTGTFLAARHTVPAMLRAGGGAVVLMSSTAGVVAETSIAAYCASKGGVVMLGRQMALDYARL